METIAIKTGSANLTEEQFFMLCSENSDIRFERDKYKNILIMAPTGAFTSESHSEINYQLKRWNHETKSGHVFDSSGGFTLPNGAMRNPDSAWVAKERWRKIPQEEKERFAHICPDFVIEVKSKTDSLSQQKEKMQEWIENGCRLGWLIDLEHKTAYVYKPGRETLQQTFKDDLNGEDVLPEFVLKLNEFF